MRTMLAIGLFLALGTASCSAGKIVVREEPDPGRAVIAVGETFTVELKGNLTTGFEWVVAAVDAQTLEVGPRRYAAKPAGGRVGVGGTFFFPAKGLKAGDTELTLEYRRPWEKDPAARTFKVDVSIVAED
ncbi:MAG: protease inhibitor I42 family protein [Elusimicrobia bacterium]|nr:protease inhibitor I42 family protein [Elusimicrobiota bacterium]